MLPRLLLILGGVLVAALLAELALRSVITVPEVSSPLYSFHESDPVLGWRGKPDVRARFSRPDFDVLVENGPDGWRLPDPAPAPDATWRLLVIGDSFAWGWGVGQGEVVTDRLQRLLPASAAVDNRGVNAFGTAQEYLLMQRELAARHYDAVAVLFFQNDVVNAVDPRGGRRPLFGLDGDRLVLRTDTLRALSNPVQRFFKDHSRVFQLADFELTQLARAGEEDVHEIVFEESETDVDYRTLPGAAVTERLLVEMNRLALAHRARFVIVYVPQRSEFENARPTSPFPYIRAVHALVRDVAAREGILLVDLSGPFHEQAQGGQALIFAQDAHWNVTGHQLAADVLRASPLCAWIDNGAGSP